MNKNDNKSDGTFIIKVVPIPNLRNKTNNINESYMNVICCIVKDFIFWWLFLYNIIYTINISSEEIIMIKYDASYCLVIS